MSLQILTDKVKALAANGSDLNAKFKFVTDEGVISVDATQNPTVVSNDDMETDVTMLISTKDALELIAGELNPMSAFMFGKLKIKGDMGLAMKIGQAIGG